MYCVCMYTHSECSHVHTCTCVCSGPLYIDHIFSVIVSFKQSLNEISAARGDHRKGGTSGISLTMS